jgi:hypothetical protein
LDENLVLSSQFVIASEDVARLKNEIEFMRCRFKVIIDQAKNGRGEL